MAKHKWPVSADALGFVAGLVCVGVGLALVSVPAALVAVGSILIALAVWPGQTRRQG